MNNNHLEAFKTWAEDHLGQGYSLEMEDGSFIDKVTRWAFIGFKAGVAHQDAQKWSTTEICNACVKSGIGILECQTLVTLLNGAASPAVLALVDRLMLSTLITLLNDIKPEYGTVGSRDVDVTARRTRIDEVIKMLTSYL